MKKLMYSAAWFIAATHASIAQAGLQITWAWEEELQGGDGTLDDIAAGIINSFTRFLTLIAVVYAIWGWFLILTAAGDDEKVKKWRTVIFHAILGLIVIWLAYAIVTWAVWLFTLGAQGNIGV